VVNWSPTPSTGTWYHLVFTYDASTDTTKWYVNGTELASSNTAYTENLFYNGSSPFTIGCDIGWNSGCFDGLIDEVTVFSATLTSTQVTSLYNSGTPLQYQSSATTNLAPVVLSDTMEIMLNSVSCSASSTSTLCSYTYATTTTTMFSAENVFIFFLLFVFTAGLSFWIVKTFL